MSKFRGSSLPEIFENRDQWRYQKKKLQFSHDHIALFNLPLPEDAKHAWDENHVRLPFSDENTTYKGERRWEIIKRSFTKNIRSISDLEDVIKSYNQRFKDIWNFSALHTLLDQYPADKKIFFFEHLLPEMKVLALQLPRRIQKPIPLLKQSSNRSISISQQQAACLLANAFFCTFPLRNTDNRNSEYRNYPKINFNRLFGSDGQNVVEKLKCILHYFERVLFSKEPEDGIITFQRQYVRRFEWEGSQVPIDRIKFHITSQGTIEEAQGMLQVDFANRFVGGGVLSHGCVQEEIRFVISPELIVARLFTECLNDDEALIVIGFQQFSEYEGYASGFKWKCDFVDKTPVDINLRRKSRLVAIDAIAYNRPHEQFDDVTVRRDINKAYAGFFCDNEDDKTPIATGFWGCGAFKGDPVRSGLIQLMACLANHRNLAFYTFGNTKKMEMLGNLFEFLVEQKTTVGQLYYALKTYRYRGNDDDLVSYIKHRCSLPKPIVCPPKEYQGRPETSSNSDYPEVRSESKKTNWLPTSSSSVLKPERKSQLDTLESSKNNQPATSAEKPEPMEVDGQT